MMYLTRNCFIRMVSLLRQSMCRYKNSLTFKLLSFYLIGSIAELPVEICIKISLYDNTPVDSGCTKAKNITGIKFTSGNLFTKF